jgi:hypothetical protein
MMLKERSRRAEDTNQMAPIMPPTCGTSVAPTHLERSKCLQFPGGAILDDAALTPLFVLEYGKPPGAIRLHRSGKGSFSIPLFLLLKSNNSVESRTKTRSRLIGAWLGADLGTSTMNHQLRIVTIRIAHVEGGGVRAWSDDLAGLSLTCPNHDVLFAELPSKITSLLQQQGLHSKIVREIHQFVVEVSSIQG